MPSAAPEPLSVEDARILALEQGPVRGHTCKLVLLDGVRGVDDLRAHVAEATDDRAVIEATLEANGKITATCRGTFVAVKEGHPAYYRW